MDNVSGNEIVTTGEKEALRNDDVTMFFMHFAIAGHLMSKGWVETIAKARAWRAAGPFLCSCRVRFSSRP